MDMTVNNVDISREYLYFFSLSPTLSLSLLPLPLSPLFLLLSFPGYSSIWRAHVISCSAYSSRSSLPLFLGSACTRVPVYINLGCRIPTETRPYDHIHSNYNTKHQRLCNGTLDLSEGFQVGVVPWEAPELLNKRCWDLGESGRQKTGYIIDRILLRCWGRQDYLSPYPNVTIRTPKLDCRVSLTILVQISSNKQFTPVCLSMINV